MNPTGSAWQLAVLGSLAVRIEPQLLRRLRLTLAPGLDATAEAALWFSPDLVSLRAPTGLVLATETLPGLRAALAEDEALLDAAWAVTALAHAAGAPALRIEEELTYLALKGLDRPEMEARARELLRSALRTMVQRGGRLAAWADRAVPRLPPAVLELEEAQMVALGAALRLGRAGPLTALGAAAPNNNWGWLAPDALRSIPMSVRWVEGGIEFGQPGAALSHPISIPALLPLAVHVWPNGPDAGPGTQVKLRPAQRRFVPLPAQARHVVVQIFAGARIVLRRPEDKAVDEKLKRIRMPRIHITYDVERSGEVVRRELPFVVGVLGGFSGHGRADGTRPLAERNFVQIDRDNFDDVLARIAPTLVLQGEDGGTLLFSCLEDFEPGRVAMQIEPLRKRLELRTALRDLVSLADRNEALENLFDEIMTDRAQAHEASLTLGAELDRPSDVGQRFLALAEQPRLETLAILIPTAVRHVLAWAGGTYRNLTVAVNAMIAEEDGHLSEGLRRVMHHRDFLLLEGSWRGLAYLVFNAETSSTLKIRILDVTKAEIATDMDDGEEGGQIHSKLYDQEFGIADGEPYGVVVCDAEWDGGAADTSTLRGLARTAAAIHAPFLSAAAPALVGLEDWRELSVPSDLSVFENSPAADGWRALRDSEDSRYLALTLPRVLARLPYRAETSPTGEFAFVEAAATMQRENRCWMSAAYVYAGRIVDSLAKWGSAIKISGMEAGGRVDDLPTDIMGGDSSIPTEVLISDRREAELARLGFIPLTSFRNQPFAAAFFSASTVQRPLRYDTEDATANAALAARLPFIMATSRFMHYLMILARDQLISHMAVPSIEAWLNRWISNYVNGNPDAGVEARARFPLREAKVELTVLDSGSEVTCVAYLRPWLPMEELTTSLRVTTVVPVSPPGRGVRA